MTARLERVVERLTRQHLPDRFGAMTVEPDEDDGVFVARVKAPKAWRFYTPRVTGGATADGPTLTAYGTTRHKAIAELEQLVGQVALDRLRHVEPDRGRGVMDVAVRFDPPFEVTLEHIWEGVAPDIIVGTLWSWMVRYRDEFLRNIVLAPSGSPARQTRVTLYDVFENAVGTIDWLTSQSGPQRLGRPQPVLRPQDYLNPPVSLKYQGLEPESVVLFVEVVRGSR